ncbi:MAG: heme-binding protein [Planctomycetota bacterium]|jgi:hypothetical protein
MPSLSALAAALLLVPTASPSFGPDEVVKRVGGDLEIQTELKPSGYRSGPHLVDTALPAGYPPPTPPGAVELKRYPTVRRAEVTGRSDANRSASGFFPLFRHIQSRDIAMTAPVEVDYHEDAWTMSFLYRTADLGPTGRDGRVRVVDAPSRTVVAIGIAGRSGMRTVSRGLESVDAWLAENTDWVRDGEPRALYYNGPSVPARRQWAEVQVPVRRADEPRPMARTPEPSHSPSELIELAVERGAPMYNDGQPAACAAIYEVTVTSLLALGPDRLDDSSRDALAEALRTAATQPDVRERAWTLRRAMDRAWQGMQRAPLARSH